GRHAGVQQQPGQGAARGLAQPGAALRREERTPGARLPVPAAGWRLSLPWRRAAAQDADPAAVMRTSPAKRRGFAILADLTVERRCPCRKPLCVWPMA